MSGKTDMRADAVRAALKRRYAQPECAVVFEVAQATGFSANRHLDAIAMELWPSRGLALHGIEIKVDLYDWQMGGRRFISIVPKPIGRITGRTDPALGLGASAAYSCAEAGMSRQWKNQ